MKKLFGIFLILLTVNVNVFSCGTIEIWSNTFYEENLYDKKIDALKFIHCEVISTHYLKSESTHSDEKSKLIQLYSDALVWTDKIANKEQQNYARLLILKGIVVFHLFETSSDKINILMLSIAEKLDLNKDLLLIELMNLKKESSLFNSNKMSLSHDAYNEYLIKETKPLFFNSKAN